MGIPGQLHCDGVIVDSETIAHAVMLESLREVFKTDGLDALMKDLFGRRVIESSCFWRRVWACP